MRDILIGAALGLIIGFVFNRVTVYQISKRSTDDNKKKFFNKPSVLPISLLVYAICFALVFRLYSDDLFKKIEYLIIISIALNITAVDYLIRKIPNESLLALMLSKTVFLAIQLVGNANLAENFWKTVKPSVIGLVVGFGIFLIPSLLHIMIGVGDIKYSGVIGYCMGLGYFLQSMAIMGIALLIYLAYLLITRKGNLKTPAAIGPYLSLGVVLTIFLPLEAIRF